MVPEPIRGSMKLHKACRQRVGLLDHWLWELSATAASGELPPPANSSSASSDPEQPIVDHIFSTTNKINDWAFYNSVWCIRKIGIGTGSLVESVDEFCSGSGLGSEESWCRRFHFRFYGVLGTCFRTLWRLKSTPRLLKRLLNPVLVYKITRNQRKPRF